MLLFFSLWLAASVLLCALWALVGWALGKVRVVRAGRFTFRVHSRQHDADGDRDTGAA